MCISYDDVRLKIKSHLWLWYIIIIINVTIIVIRELYRQNVSTENIDTDSDYRDGDVLEISDNVSCRLENTGDLHCRISRATVRGGYVSIRLIFWLILDV